MFFVSPIYPCSFKQPISNVGPVGEKTIKNGSKIESVAKKNLSVGLGKRLATKTQLLSAGALHINEKSDLSLMKKLLLLIKKTYIAAKIFFKNIFHIQDPLTNILYEQLSDQLHELVETVRKVHREQGCPKSLISIPLCANIKSVVDFMVEGKEIEKRIASMHSFYTLLCDEAISLMQATSNEQTIKEEALLAEVFKFLKFSHRRRYIQREFEADGVRIGKQVGIALREILIANPDLDMETVIKSKNFAIEKEIFEFFSAIDIKDRVLQKEAKNKVIEICKKEADKAILYEIRASADRLNDFRLGAKHLVADFLSDYPDYINDMIMKDPCNAFDSINLFDDFALYMQQGEQEELAYLMKIAEHVSTLCSEVQSELKKGKKSVEIFPHIFVHPKRPGSTIQIQDIETLLQDAVGDGSHKNPGSPTLVSILINSLVQEYQHRKDPTLKALLLKIDAVKPSSKIRDEVQFSHLRNLFLRNNQHMSSFTTRQFTSEIESLRAILLGFKPEFVNAL